MGAHTRVRGAAKKWQPWLAGVRSCADLSPDCGLGVRRTQTEARTQKVCVRCVGVASRVYSGMPCGEVRATSKCLWRHHALPLREKRERYSVRLMVMQNLIFTRRTCDIAAPPKSNKVDPPSSIIRTLSDTSNSITAWRTEVTLSCCWSHLALGYTWAHPGPSPSGAPAPRGWPA